MQQKFAGCNITCTLFSLALPWCTVIRSTEKKDEFALSRPEGHSSFLVRLEAEKCSTESLCCVCPFLFTLHQLLLQSRGRDWYHRIQFSLISQVIKSEGLLYNIPVKWKRSESTRQRQWTVTHTWISSNNTHLNPLCQRCFPSSEYKILQYWE